MRLSPVVYSPQKPVRRGPQFFCVQVPTLSSSASWHRRQGRARFGACLTKPQVRRTRGFEREDATPAATCFVPPSTRFRARFEGFVVIATDAGNRIQPTRYAPHVVNHPLLQRYRPNRAN